MTQNPTSPIARFLAPTALLLFPEPSLAAPSTSMASFHGASFHGASFHGASFQGARQRIVTLVREADRLPLTKAWSKLGEIQDLEAPENTKLKALQAAAEDSGAVGKLIVARSYLDLDEEGVFGTKAVELVGPILLGSGPQEQRIAAATILGDKDLRTTARGKARKVLEQIVRDDTSEQTVRLTAAKSLFNAGNSRMARSMLLEFYESADRQLRIEGALALAEIGDLRSVRPILEEIERQPSVAGRLARAYLDKEKQQHFFDLMLKDLRKQLDNQETNRSNGNRTNRRDKLFVLRQLMGMVRRLHIEGDEIREEQLVDAAAKGMLRSVDRFSSYLTSDEYKRFAFDLNRDYGGIGAYVNNPDGRFQITRPIYSGPAYRQGLMSGDRILEVDGWETTDQELSEIIRRLKGKPGTPVTVKVWRAGWPEPKDYTLPRAVIQLPSVSTLLLPGDVGYVELITFGLFAAKEVKDAVEDLERRGARALIVDLRNNTGGYLQQAKEVAELFLSKNKLIVFTKSRIEAEEKFISAGASFPDIPLVVLVNGNSASASEIVAGALQDHARAKIVGSQTYGKGSVQHLRPVPGRPEEPYVDENENRRKDEWEPYTDLNSNGKWDPGPRARITIAYYYLPSGRCLHKRVDMDGKVKDKNYGVLPDRKIDGRHLEVKELWKNAVINELWQQRVFHKYVDEHLAHNKARFIGLAEGDGGKTESYPGFEDFYKGLKTQLSRDDVRRWIRVVVREKVADYRGKAWPGGRLIGDYQEDRQLQGAIETALDMVGDKIVAFPEYKNILKLEKEKKDKPVKIGKK